MENDNLKSQFIYSPELLFHTFMFSVDDIDIFALALTIEVSKCHSRKIINYE